MEVLKGMSKIVCSRERELALECWTLLHQGKLTDTAKNYFNEQTAEVYFNTGSGNVFLSDEDYNTVMECDGELDLFISLSYHGDEGFLLNLLEDLKNGNIPEEDHEELYNYCDDNQKEDLKKHFKHLEE